MFQTRVALTKCRVFLLTPFVQWALHKNPGRSFFEAARYRACASRTFTTCQMSNVCCAMFNVVVKTPDDLLTKPPNPQWETI